MGQRHYQLQFAVFDWLRFPLIVGVVFIHCYGSPFDYNALDFENLSSIDIFNLFRVCISKVLTHICVPTFFYISGYLFFVGMEKWNYKKYIEKIKRRCHTLLIPFIIWNTISIFVSMVIIFHYNSWEGIVDFFEKNRYLHLYWDCHRWNYERTNWLGGGSCIKSISRSLMVFKRSDCCYIMFAYHLHPHKNNKNILFVYTIYLLHIWRIYPNPGFFCNGFFVF